MAAGVTAKLWELAGQGVGGLGNALSEAGGQPEPGAPAKKKSRGGDNDHK
jgi:hypothetical protein